jgi:hypothetical protein
MVSVAPDQLDAFVELLADSEIDFMNLGEVKGSAVVVDGKEYGKLEDFRNLYENSIGNLMQQEKA